MDRMIRQMTTQVNKQWTHPAMTDSLRTELLQSLSEVAELSPDVRIGQMLANVGFLVEARAGGSIWDIDDSDLLRVVQQHRDELERRIIPSAT